MVFIMKLESMVFSSLVLGAFLITNLFQTSYSLTNNTIENATGTDLNYSIVGEDNSNSNSSTNIESCNMPPCPPGKACIQVCPNSGPQ